MSGGDRAFGPDGPWNTIQIDVGGNTTSDIPLVRQQTSVYVLPGSTWETVIPNSDTCSIPSLNNSTCGIGGTWDPSSASVVTLSGGILSPAAGIYSDSADFGNIHIEALTLATDQGARTVDNVSLATLHTATVSYPNGVVAGLELGFLALDSGTSRSLAQVFLSSSVNGALALPYKAWMYSGYMFEQNVTASYSYGLQIGSAALGYPGSLVFGGYDSGRVIGPYIAFNNSLLLSNISIGVEVGASPFLFEDSLESLLITNTSKKAPIAVEPDPAAPYLHLHGNTCDAIAAAVPAIYFDPVTRYYLWNQSHPGYEKIVKSSAHLAFTFSLSEDINETENVIIKVPFMLLNLILTAPVVQ